MVPTLSSPTRLGHVYWNSLRASWLGAIAMLAACGSATTPDSKREGPVHIAKVEPRLSNSSSSEVPVQDDNVVAERIDDVWVFFHRDRSPKEGIKNVSAQARNAGVARIVGGCLYIGDSIVVWGRLRADDIQAAILAARRGEQHHLKMSGGGRSLDEGARPESFPSIITERCPTRTIWWADKLDVGDEFLHP